MAEPEVVCNTGEVVVDGHVNPDVIVPMAITHNDKSGFTGNPENNKLPDAVVNVGVKVNVA